MAIVSSDDSFVASGRIPTRRGILLRAASGAAQLEWVYQHSPWAEPSYRRYPVLRWLGK